MPPLSISAVNTWGAADGATPVTLYQPPPGAPGVWPPSSAPVSDAEALLAAWFGRPVVLLSAGRTGLRAVLQLLGLQRHRDRVRIPKYLSRCVINAVTFQALPIETAEGATASLLYHQFGFPQIDCPPGLVIEDIAHAFFADATAGSRQWLADYAIFSLPKFFPMAGLAGGVITSTIEQADSVRRHLDRSTPASPDALDWMRAVYSANAHNASGQAAPESPWLDAAYELLYKFERPDAAALAGLPRSLEGLQEVGIARSSRVRVFLEFFKGTHPAELWPEGADPVPYALPYFGRHGREGLMRAKAALVDNGFQVDLYHVDVRRSAASPEYRCCLLLPCHHEVEMGRFERMCQLVAAHDRAHD